MSAEAATRPARWAAKGAVALAPVGALAGLVAVGINVRQIEPALIAYVVGAVVAALVGVVVGGVAGVLLPRGSTGAGTGRPTQWVVHRRRGPAAMRHPLPH